MHGPISAVQLHICISLTLISMWQVCQFALVWYFETICSEILNLAFTFKSSSFYLEYAFIYLVSFSFCGKAPTPHQGLSTSPRPVPCFLGDDFLVLGGGSTPLRWLSLLISNGTFSLMQSVSASISWNLVLWCCWLCDSKVIQPVQTFASYRYAKG